MFAVDLEYLTIWCELCMYMYMNLVIYILLLMYIAVYRSFQIHSETHRFINTNMLLCHHHIHKYEHWKIRAYFFKQNYCVLLLEHYKVN